MPMSRFTLVLLCLVASASATATDIPVRLDVATTHPVSGRLIVFAQRVDPAGPRPDSIDIESFAPPADTAIAARDVDDLDHGENVRVDADDVAWPGAFARLPEGDYWVQALLDTNHDYAHFGRTGGDITGPLRKVHLDAGGTFADTLVLDRVVPTLEPWTFDHGTLPMILDAAGHAKAHSHAYAFPSPSLEAFSGRQVMQRGWVLLPPGYDPKKRYATVYSLATFSGNVPRLTFDVTLIDMLMVQGILPPMVWVFPDYAARGGTHEFADSVNNGPWGEAFVRELIPWVEGHYAVDRAPARRLLTGHSSGGWASLWLQVRYPDTFGGTWSTGPDPIDFHDFLNTDLYAKGANAYRGADGSVTPAARRKGKVVANVEDVARIEHVLGDTGGQLSSFEWSFSPRGDDGRPVPLFDRRTGAVDPTVAAYWRRYDIVALLGPHPDAAVVKRLHVIVGAEDNYYLDGPVRRLAALPGLSPQVRIVEGRNHNDLHQVGEDRLGLFRTIGKEMADAAGR